MLNESILSSILQVHVWKAKERWVSMNTNARIDAWYLSATRPLNIIFQNQAFSFFVGKAEAQPSLPSISTSTCAKRIPAIARTEKNKICSMCGG